MMRILLCALVAAFVSTSAARAQPSTTVFFVPDETFIQSNGNFFVVMPSDHVGGPSCSGGAKTIVFPNYASVADFSDDADVALEKSLFDVQVSMALTALAAGKELRVQISGCYTSGSLTYQRGFAVYAK